MCYCLKINTTVSPAQLLRHPPLPSARHDVTVTIDRAIHVNATRNRAVKNVLMISMVLFSYYVRIELVRYTGV